jgi:hypothetical protein
MRFFNLKEKEGALISRKTIKSLWSAPRLDFAGLATFFLYITHSKASSYQTMKWRKKRRYVIFSRAAAAALLLSLLFSLSADAAPAPPVTPNPPLEVFKRAAEYLRSVEREMQDVLKRTQTDLADKDFVCFGLGISGDELEKVTRATVLRKFEEQRGWADLKSSRGAVAQTTPRSPATSLVCSRYGIGAAEWRAAGCPTPAQNPLDPYLIAPNDVLNRSSRVREYYEAAMQNYQRIADYLREADAAIASFIPRWQQELVGKDVSGYESPKPQILTEEDLRNAVSTPTPPFLADLVSRDTLSYSDRIAADLKRVRESFGFSGIENGYLAALDGFITDLGGWVENGAQVWWRLLVQEADWRIAILQTDARKRAEESAARAREETEVADREHDEARSRAQLISICERYDAADVQYMNNIAARAQAIVDALASQRLTLIEAYRRAKDFKVKERPFPQPDFAFEHPTYGGKPIIGVPASIDGYREQPHPSPVMTTIGISPCKDWWESLPRDLNDRFPAVRSFRRSDRAFWNDSAVPSGFASWPDHVVVLQIDFGRPKEPLAVTVKLGGRISDPNALFGAAR